MMIKNSAQVAPIGKTKRIRAFDILRGYFLIVILINHIELYPSFFDFFTGRGRLLVSAAEGFFFMSGLLVGIIYKRRIQLGFTFILKKMWRRAFSLYIGSILLTFLFTAAAVYFNHPAIKEGIADPISWPHIIKSTLLMTYSFGWADFLYRFAILMVMAPFGFYLLTKGKWWLLAIISFIVWAAPGNGNPLDILNWQLIFFMGMMGGFYWQDLQDKFSAVRPKLRARIKIFVSSFAAITFLLSYASVFLLSKLNQNLLGAPQHMPHWLQTLTLKWNSVNEYVWLYAQKWTIGPLRIILFLAWFAVLFMIVNRYEDQIHKYTKGTVELLGRNSLFVYLTHAFIVFGFKFAIPTHTNIFQNFAITAAALTLLISLTLAYQSFNLRRGLGIKANQIEADEKMLYKSSAVTKA